MSAREQAEAIVLMWATQSCAERPSLAELADLAKRIEQALSPVAGAEPARPEQADQPRRKPRPQPASLPSPAPSPRAEGSDVRAARKSVLQQRVAGAAKHLRELREQAGLSLRELSAASGISKAQLCGFETGARTPTAEHISAIEKACGEERPTVTRASTKADVAKVVGTPAKGDGDRRTACRHYNTCLEYANSQKWPSFDCTVCKLAKGAAA